MLTILTGRAGSGKTRGIMRDIKRRMEAGERGMLLIVPEQYSHDAERQLCEQCGDALSLHAEVQSFTRLCRRVFDETGGVHGRILDKSGQILAMHRALESTLPGLKVYGVRKTRTELLENLLVIVKELRSMCVTPRNLEELSAKTTGPLAEKLQDIALIMDSYAALMDSYGGDAAGRLDLLASKIASSTLGNEGHIYIDGFNDFTGQEIQVIEELLKKGADVTVCLTCDKIDSSGISPGYGEVFELPRKTATQLSSIAADINYVHAEEQGVQADGGNGGGQGESRHDALAFLEEHLFDEGVPVYDGENDAITILKAPSKYTECEYAAAKILEMVRSGYRWRDIGVMARDIREYETICGHVFDKYGIPYFASGRADIQNKPPVALIDAALETTVMGCEYKSVFRYLKTGLLGLSVDEISLLENYVILWNIRGSLWLREWVMPPSGYKSGRSGEKQEAADKETLKKINILREKITQPLKHLRDSVKGETPVSGKLRGLYEFLSQINLHENLFAKSEKFREYGQLRLADEYLQLSDIIIDAIDQMYSVLGDSKLTAPEFRRLVQIVLSQHDVGVIPVSLDRVPVGSMAMSRRRELKCLIMLGATDENLPCLGQGAGVLSDNERKELSKLDSKIYSGFEQRLCREMNIIYSTLTLPSDKLIMIYETSDNARASYIVKRLCEMFSVEDRSISREEYMSAAEIPYSELCYCSGADDKTIKREYLSPQAAKRLYGEDISLSATRVDGYFSCPYKHFLQNGLSLKPLKPAQFDAITAGLFMHHVLDGVLSDIKSGVGFDEVRNEMLTDLIKKHTDEYVRDVLMSFEGKNERFSYLFRRYEKSVLSVVQDMVDELKCSNFRPAEFEMDISGISKKQRGFIDRVDVFDDGAKLYFKIVDYKTRKKAYTFSLCDVLYGRDMQMLIYLFALAKYGENKFGRKAEPAGLLYIPARDVVISASRDATDEEIEKKRVKEMRRSGLVLNDPSIIEAMENGDEKHYLPVKRKRDGELTGDSLVSGSQIKQLSEHVESKIDEAKQGILGGVTDCTPYYRDINDNACAYCDFKSVCRFDEQAGDKHKYAPKLSTKEVWEKLPAV